MQIVNGYPCANCSEVSLAKRGVDPRRPDEDPLRGGQARSQENAPPRRQPDPFGDAVTFSGLVANSVQPVSASEPAQRLGAAVDRRA